MCHKIAKSQLGGPSMEHLHSSSETGKIWICMASIPVLSASIFGLQDFLNHGECIANDSVMTGDYLYIYHLYIYLHIISNIFTDNGNIWL